jgi:hypothetical protein
MNHLLKLVKAKKGIIVSYVLVFGTAFLILLGGLFGFILLQIHQASQKVAWNEALEIAEAGINYYRWCLNNEVEQNCLTEKDYLDPAGNPIGKFSLEVTSTASCGETIQREIISTGWTNDFPDTKRKISVLYARESIAKYPYIISNNVWVGSDHVIRGPFHSNGGIRMDGENQSLVTSAKEEWICTSSFDCCRWVYFGSPYYDYGWDCSQNCPASCTVNATGTTLIDGTPVKDECVCPGAFTTTGNSNPDLFSFPVPPFDFVGITIDLAKIKKLTYEQGQGIYFGPSGQKGYYIVFKENRSIDVWTVDSVTTIDNVCTVVGFKVICDDDPCQPECSKCQSGKCIVHDPGFNPATGSKTFLGNYLIPDCGLVFFEDNLWVGNLSQESKIKGKITVVSADLINPGGKTDVWLQGDINYTALDGSDGLAIIAQHNNLIGLYSPDQMELRGIFIAQTGFFGRNYYPCPAYTPYCRRTGLEITGSVVSDGRVGTQWGSGVSGYLNRESYFDANLIYNPPSFIPYITPEFKILTWGEVK